MSYVRLDMMNPCCCALSLKACMIGLSCCGLEKMACFRLKVSSMAFSALL